MDSTKPGEKISLELTETERAVLVDKCTLLPPDFQHLIGEASLSEPIMLTADEAQLFGACITVLADRARDKKRQKMLDVISGKIYYSIHAHFGNESPPPLRTRADKKRKPMGGPKASSKSVTPGLLYQFKITLLRIEPPIWRRIQVKDCTLDKLHEHIQTAMGWTNSHLHQFKVGGETYGNPELLEDDFHCLDSTRTKVSSILPTDGKPFSFKYEYDFGDCWEHEVLFEGCPPVDPKAKYPLCLEGERACPPEDCGGAGGYADFLEAIGDGGHKQHDEMLESIGGSFDPEAFDPVTATASMKKGLPDWRESEDDDWLLYGE